MSTVNPASVRAVAKKDFQDAVRSMLFWGLSFFFFLLIAVMAGAIAWYQPDDLTTHSFIAAISEVTKLVVPLIALVLGWKSIAGERESGSIQVLLSLPHSRVDVVLGKLVGRAAVLSLSIVIGFALAAVFLPFAVADLAIGEYIGFTAMTVLYGLAYTSIAVSLSSLTRSTTVAGAAMFGVFLTFYVIWNSIQILINELVTREYISGVEYSFDIDGETISGERSPDWAYFIDNIDPGNAYQNAITVVSSVPEDAIGTVLEDVFFPDGVPFFLQDWFSFLILLAWIVVPVLLAAYRFDRVDL